MAGMSHTSGLVSRRGWLGVEDATAVRRLRRAGCIPLAVTNTSELCMWMETSNKVSGRTCNPYDRRRIVGGSSGGEGALVSAGGSPFGLGSDVGGSIRMPAFFNGIFGHKPSAGVVPNTGQHPIATGYGLRYLTTGPLCRRAEDLMPLLRVLAGPDGRDTGVREVVLGREDEVDLDGLAVTVIEGIDSPLHSSVSPEMAGARERVVGYLESSGARAKWCRPEPLEEAAGIWSAMLYEANGSSFREDMENGRSEGFLGESLRALLGGGPFTFPGAVLALFERMPYYTAGTTARLVKAGRELRRILDEEIGEGVLVFPSYPTLAPPHRAPFLPPANWAYTAIFNVMELPVTQVPLGLDRQGLPLGVQIAARHSNDHLTIGVARHLERAFGGWIPPPSCFRRHGRRTGESEES